MELKEEIKCKIKMKDVLEMYGVYPIRGSNIYRCIYHCDEHPSAHISKTDRFKCFSGSCAIIKDIFDIVQDQEKCDFYTSMKILDSRFNLGIIGDLTPEKRKEFARIKQIRDEEKLKNIKFEKWILNKIIIELRFWEQIEKDTHITRGEYRRGEWKYADLFFYALERQHWLNWLYETLCGYTDKRECEFDYVYGTDKMKLLKKIKNNEIYI